MSRLDVLSEPGRFGPLDAAHTGVGKPYALCETPMRVGDVPALVELGPADDEEAAKAAEGRAHNVEAALVHESCAWPK